MKNKSSVWRGLAMYLVISTVVALPVLAVTKVGLWISGI